MPVTSQSARSCGDQEISSEAMEKFCSSQSSLETSDGDADIWLASTAWRSPIQNDAGMWSVAVPNHIGIRAQLRASMAEGSKRSSLDDDRSLEALWTTQSSIAHQMEVLTVEFFRFSVEM
ncbi:hypothetical protein M5K25_018980 [Dendrobium thyrsiflorum]|uniref:Uncharacterized protein n=1 Tax=Dendrobium thyrsiflorum TaxID=117978 RepID=A0ABD0UDU0_DENTH